MLCFLLPALFLSFFWGSNGQTLVHVAMEQPDDMTSCQKPCEEEHTPQYVWVHFSLCTVYGNSIWYMVTWLLTASSLLKVDILKYNYKTCRSSTSINVCLYIYIFKRCKARLYPQLVHILTLLGSCSTVFAWRRRPPSDLHWRRTSAEDGGQEQDEKIKFRDIYMFV